MSRVASLILLSDGGKNPTFQEKFVFTVVEGQRELLVVVWNSNTISNDVLIGGGKVQLQKVLSEGCDDRTWPLHTKLGSHAGDVRLIMHCPNAKKYSASSAPSVPPYASYVPQDKEYFTLATPPSQPYRVPYTPPATAYSSPFPYMSYPLTSMYPPPKDGILQDRAKKKPWHFQVPIRESIVLCLEN